MTSFFKVTALATVAVTGLMAVSAQAGVTFYSDQSAFTAALGSSVTEDFTDASLVSGLSFVSDVGYVDTAAGNFHDRPIVGGPQTTFSFAGGANGFGANFDETPGGFGQGLNFTIDFTLGGNLLLSQTLGTSSGQFFGFISTDSFDSVVIHANDSNAGVAETYTLDNLQFGNAAASPAPEAATWAMMVGGFGMVGGAMRRRTKSAVSFG